MAALATTEDVKKALKALQRPEVAEALQPEDVSDLLQEASDLVTGHLWPSPVPDPTPGEITRVTAAMVAASLIRPKEILPETASLTADGFGATFTPGTTSPGVYLTAALKARLRPFRSGFTSVAMGSERY
ncbi:head-to-tail adaptor [Mycobacterium phage Fefferhead]|nr:head-to-tail adaptor [Mycobacterium phage Fefferhead]